VSLHFLSTSKNHIPIIPIGHCRLSRCRVVSSWLGHTTMLTILKSNIYPYRLFIPRPPNTPPPAASATTTTGPTYHIYCPDGKLLRELVNGHPDPRRPMKPHTLSPKSSSPWVFLVSSSRVSPFIRGCFLGMRPFFEILVPENKSVAVIFINM